MNMNTIAYAIMAASITTTDQRVESRETINETSMTSTNRMSVLIQGGA
jgi:hypothetical protein